MHARVARREDISMGTLLGINKTIPFCEWWFQIAAFDPRFQL